MFAIQSRCGSQWIVCLEVRYKWKSSMKIKIPMQYLIPNQHFLKIQYFLHPSWHPPYFRIPLHNQFHMVKDLTFPRRIAHSSVLLVQDQCWLYHTTIITFAFSFLTVANNNVLGKYLLCCCDDGEGMDPSTWTLSCVRRKSFRWLPHNDSWLMYSIILRLLRIQLYVYRFLWVQFLNARFSARLVSSRVFVCATFRLGYTERNSFSCFIF